MFNFILWSFPVKYINWWLEIPISITPFCEIVSLEFVRMWSISVEKQHVVRVACLLSAHCYTKFVTGTRLCKIWFNLGINLPLWRKFILKSPSKNISLSNFIPSMLFKTFQIVDRVSRSVNYSNFAFGHKISKNILSISPIAVLLKLKYKSCPT